MNHITKFLTCGSVDDGKSTMIGRLLFDAGLIYEDQLQSLKSELEKNGMDTNSIDYSFLLDGLLSEREQGITIDVAYRYFSINNKKFIVADTPGHTQYTKNMATGASHCDAAIILIDARKGLGLQTNRHSLICSLMGISKILFAINKFDLVNWDEKVFLELSNKCQDLVHELEEVISKKIDFSSIPISALLGDNLLYKSMNMPWYENGTIHQWLDNLVIDKDLNDSDTSFVVQYVIKSYDHANPYQFSALENLTENELSKLRAYAGILVSGNLSLGQKVKISSSDIITTIKGILKGFQFVNSASKGESVSIILEDEIDISRGDIIKNNDSSISFHSDINATIIWMGSVPLENNGRYIIKGCFGYVNANINKIDFKYNLESFKKIKTEKLEINEVGVVDLHFHKKIYAEAYNSNRQLGSFVIIDKLNNLTIGCGMINSFNDLEIPDTEDNIGKKKKPFVLWFTGLSGSGKTTTAENLIKELFKRGYNSVSLDGDILRQGLCNDLGFSDSDRSENIRRTAEIAKLILDSGVNVLCSLISPFEKDRQLAREILSEYNFVEIFINASIEICEKRDIKGYYKKAREGEINNFTGISSKYENPINPEITINTELLSFDEATNKILNYLESKDYLV